ncbi:putative reverse transcriptase domain-containing protein [Tanacetum coccineum]|uniref:Reverse transcriptase domain-containing protein n=1 Tax=Tanacetum coccineum TaxID=301880 RepID=A0ABQ5E586_9ASTR
MTHKEIEDLVTRRVAEEMEARKAVMNLEPLSKNGDEQECENEGNGNGGNEGNGNGGNKGNGNGGNRGNGENGNGNRNGNQGMNYGGFMPVAQECIFQDFVKCKPHNFSRTKGVVGLTRWFEKMKTNSYKRTIGIDVAYVMNWAGLMRLMTKELILLCTRMVPDEEDRVERFIGGLPDNIQGNSYAARSAENKRRMESNPKDNRRQQTPFKRKNTSWQNVARAYTAGNNEKRGVVNQTGGNKDTAKAYAIGGGGTNPDSNVVTGTFLLNNCYASMLFDLRTDRSFVSNTFNAFLDVAPSTLDTSYAVELASGRISEINVVLRGYTLGLLGHPFDIDLMPVELGSFDVIIGMDWLAKYHALIVCDEKVIRIPYGDEVYLAQVTSKKVEDRSEEKRLEDVPIVREFLEVFPEDLPGLLPA